MDRMQIQRITLAVEDMDSMVEFYNAIFGCGLAPVNGSPVSKGRFADIDLVVCPNSVAGVIADQNRHQFRLVVDDAEALATRIEVAGSSGRESRHLGREGRRRSCRPGGKHLRTGKSIDRECKTRLSIRRGEEAERDVSRRGRWSRGRLYDDRILWPILAFALRILRTGRRLVPSTSAG